MLTQTKKGTADGGPEEAASLPRTRVPEPVPNRFSLATRAGSARRAGGVRTKSARLLAGLRAKSLAAYGVWRLRAADQRGSQITDNLGLVVIGIVAIIAIGGLISGLDKTVFNWVTGQLGLSSTGGAG